MSIGILENKAHVNVVGIMGDPSPPEPPVTTGLPLCNYDLSVSKRVEVLQRITVGGFDFCESENVKLSHERHPEDVYARREVMQS